jgi:hypothetical protein
MQRRRFTSVLALGLAGAWRAVLALGVSSCSPRAPTSATPASGDGLEGRITLNHGHSAVLTPAQLAAGAPARLDITGRSTHSHFLDLTADDVVRIRAGESVSRHSSDGFDDKHDHLVTFN